MAERIQRLSCETLLTASPREENQLQHMQLDYLLVIVQVICEALHAQGDAFNKEPKLQVVD